MKDKTEPKVSRCWCERRATEFVHYVPRWLGGHPFKPLPDLNALARALANDPEYWEQEP